MSLSSEEIKWNLNEYSRPVATVVIAAVRATMEQILKNLNSLFNYEMRFFAVNINDKPDTTGIVFVSRIV
jgi:N-methylhydantoinase A/oxoprolinase/acetone carboxylase beta subunit